MKLRWFKNLASTRDFLFSLALVSGQVVALSTLASCGWFASTDGFEQYKGKLPDKSFVVLDDKDKKVTFKEGFSKDNYPRPVQIVDVKSPLDKTYMESAFASLAVLADRFDIDLQNPIPRIDESQSLDFLYNAAFRRGYRVFVLPSYLHGITFKQYYLKNKAAFEKEKDFLFVGVDYKFDKDLVKPGHSVTLNFKTEESSFVVGYAAARYIAERYSDPDERVMSAFAGVPYRGATDYTFGFLEGIKYWNQTQKQKVKFLGNRVDTSSGFYVASPQAGTAINRSLAGGKTKIVFPAAGGSIARRLLSESEDNKDLLLIGVDTDVAKALTEYKDRIFSSSLKNMGTWIYKVLEDYYTGSYKILKENENLDFYKGLRDGWVGVAPSTIPKDASKIDRYLKEAEETFLKVLDGKLKSDWAKDYKMYLNSSPEDNRPNLIPEALASIVADINKLFESGSKKK